MQVRKSTQLTAYASSATTCLGTGKRVGVLCKTAQKRGTKKKKVITIKYTVKNIMCSITHGNKFYIKSSEVFTFTNG